MFFVLKIANRLKKSRWGLEIKKLKNRKTDRTVGLNFCISSISSGTAWLLQGMNLHFSFLNPKFCWSDPPGSGSFALSVGPFSILRTGNEWVAMETEFSTFNGLMQIGQDSCINIPHIMVEYLVIIISFAYFTYFFNTNTSGTKTTNADIYKW